MFYKKPISILLSALIILSSLTFSQTIVKAESDTIPPVLNNISIDKETVSSGEKITVTADASDDISEIKSIEVYYNPPSGSATKYVSLSKNDEGNYIGTITIGQNDAVGMWKVNFVTLTDNASNSINVLNTEKFTNPEDGELQDLSSGGFEVKILNIGIPPFTQKCITQNETWTSNTINGDLYVGPQSVLTINGSVSVNGDIYVLGAIQNYGNLNVTGTIYASQFNWGNSILYYGTVLMLGGTNYIGSMAASNNPIDIPFKVYETDEKNTLITKDGILNITGATLPIIDLYVDGTKIDYNFNGTFSLNLNVANITSVTFQLIDIYGNKKDVKYNLINSNSDGTIPVTGVSLTKNQESMNVGEITTLITTVTPEQASNKNVTWLSSNTTVATVDNSGKVTAVSAGTATITVTTEDGSKTYTSSVTVNNPASTVIFNSNEGSLVDNQIIEYDAKVTKPTDPTKTGYTFDGWYKEDECTNTWDFIIDKVTVDTILFAKWIVDAPGIPTSLKASSLSYNSIDISWSGVIGANGYEVYRSLTSTSTSTLISTTTETNYNNTRLSTNSVYYYKVRAYRMVGTVKVYSGFTSVISAKTIPATPTSVKAVSSSYNSINISWGGVIGSSKYQIYRATSIAGSYILISTTTGKSYNNTSLATNINYYYKVRTYWMVGTFKVYSVFSTAISAKPIPAAPTLVKTSSSSYNSVNISWSGVSGASRYEVYRATTGAGSYTLVSTITATRYNNTGLTTNSTYYYKVRAYRMVGTVKVYSGFSSVISAKPIPAAPTSVKASSTSYNSINVSWSGVNGASGYEVYRATSSAGSCALVSSTTATSYKNTGLVTNSTYYYLVRAYRMVGTVKVYSGFLSVISAKPIPSTPINVKATRINSKNIKLTWSTVTGANGYEVYKATSSTGIYRLLTIIKCSYYTNTGLISGRTYYYKTRSYRTVGKTRVYGNWSAVVHAKP